MISLLTTLSLLVNDQNEPSCGKTGGRLGSGHSSEERDDRFPVYTTNRSGGMVMTSSPKPSLRPFFSSSKSTIASGQHDPEVNYSFND